MLNAICLSELLQKGKMTHLLRFEEKFGETF